MLTDLLIFRSAMVRQMRDLPDAFRAMPRDFVRILSDSGGPCLGTPSDTRDGPVTARTGCLSARQVIARADNDIRLGRGLRIEVPFGDGFPQSSGAIAMRPTLPCIILALSIAFYRKRG
jgi:hypothetical protein